jgi:hypothetical protein
MGRGWQNKQLRMARKVLARKRALLPNKPTNPLIPKADFIKAIKGTWGIETTIAKNLDVTRQTVVKYLNMPGWEDVREEWLNEIETAGDDCLEVLKTAVDNSNPLKDFSNATLNARWYLERRRRKQFGNESKTIIEGGENPIKTQSTVLTLDALNLPIEIQRKILEHMDAKEEKERELKGQIIGAVVEPAEPKQLEREKTESEDETDDPCCEKSR